MKQIYTIIIFVLIFVTCAMISCDGIIIEVPTTEIDYDPESPFRAALINTDAASNEVMKIATADMDTLIYYGTKDRDGVVLNFHSVEFNSHTGTSNIIDLDSIGKIKNIYNNTGTSISFEWITETSAVINAHSQEHNYHISTVIDFNNLTNNAYTSAKTKAIKNSNRNGSLKLEINKNSETWRIPTRTTLKDVKNTLGAQSQYDPDDYFFTQQEVWLWIYQCSSSYNAQNYLIMKNASNGVTIGKLTNPEYMKKGNYLYYLPYSSYPSSATNKELCKNIDNALINFEEMLGNVLIESEPLILAINSAAMALAPSTGGASLGLAAISDLIVSGAVIADCLLQLANYAGGISALMEWGNSEWYYKEYIISDLTLTPVGFTQTKTVMGEPHRINPNDNNILITLDMQGDPVINSFTLNPSNPGAGISYTATADYHCIPENSTITLSIIGTDGYTDSITENISDSGSAILHVPGAESGVYDLCTVKIDMPFAETLIMEASLVFGN